MLIKDTISHWGWFSVRASGSEMGGAASCPCFAFDEYSLVCLSWNLSFICFYYTLTSKHMFGWCKVSSETSSIAVALVWKWEGCRVIFLWWLVQRFFMTQLPENSKNRKKGWLLWYNVSGLWLVSLFHNFTISQTVLEEKFWWALRPELLEIHIHRGNQTLL